MSEFHHLSHRLAAAAATDLFNRERRERRSEITPQGGVGAPRGELKWNSPKTSKMITFFRGEQERGIVKMANDLGDLALTLRLKDTTSTHQFLFIRIRRTSSDPILPSPPRRVHHAMISLDRQTDRQRYRLQCHSEEDSKMNSDDKRRRRRREGSEKSTFSG